MSLEELIATVKQTSEAHDAAKLALELFERDPQNNVFESLAKAEYELEDVLRHRASADCEGSYNCGAEEYRQGFFVDGVEYVAIATVEYNRHDKTYYYIEEFDFRIEAVTA
ncbi:hypothetical protein [Paraburkholderia caffeinilytica]|uniref:hypothetical protein n=1 Tax=Paraburkholderia caffeinilytica TaxID=1761016 RepID=UPI0038BCDB97